MTMTMHMNLGSEGGLYTYICKTDDRVGATISKDDEQWSFEDKSYSSMKDLLDAHPEIEGVIEK